MGIKDDLIWGKDPTDRIISIETVDNKIVIFRQNENNEIETIERPATFWFLTNRYISSKQELLEGNQHYRHIGKFSTLKERDDVVRKLKKNNIDFYRIFNHKEQTLTYEGMTYFKGLHPNMVSILSFDIETTGLVHNADSLVLIISNTYRDSNGKITRKLFALDDYASEKDMLVAWIKWVRKINPSIMCGHNIFGFDLPYLQFRARANKIWLTLGRDGSSLRFDPYETAFRVNGSNDIDFFNAHIFGREIIDTMFLSYKHDIVDQNYESYALKSIVRYEGLEKPDRTFIDSSKIRDYWKYRNTDPEMMNMWKLTKVYAEEDSDDALKLFDLQAPPLFYFSQHISKTFQQIANSATGAQINNFLVRSYLQTGHSVAKTTELVEHVKGGISFAVPGIYRNLYKIDLKSCYPSQILRFKLYDADKDPFAHFYQMVEHFTLERFALKKKFKETGDVYYEGREKSSKIFINSAYGLCNTPGLNYNSPKTASKITGESRKVIDFALKWASSKGVDYWMDLFEQKTKKKKQIENEDA